MLLLEVLPPILTECGHITVLYFQILRKCNGCSLVLMSHQCHVSHCYKPFNCYKPFKWLLNSKIHERKIGEHVDVTVIRECGEHECTQPFLITDYRLFGLKTTQSLILGRKTTHFHLNVNLLIMNRIRRKTNYKKISVKKCHSRQATLIEYIYYICTVHSRS